MYKFFCKKIRNTASTERPVESVRCICIVFSSTRWCAVTVKAKLKILQLFCRVLIHVSFPMVQNYKKKVSKANKSRTLLR